MCNRIEKDGSQSTLVVYVDDILILAKDEKLVGYIMDEMEKRFGEVTKHKGEVLNYIGMTFDFSMKRKVIIKMQGYVEDLMKYVSGREASDPARSGNSVLLNEKERKFFHTLVAKLLYLGKRVRPDILVAITDTSLEASRTMPRSLVPLMYCVTLFTFSRSYSFDFCTLLQRNNIATRISGRTLLPRYRSFAT